MITPQYSDRAVLAYYKAAKDLSPKTRALETLVRSLHAARKKSRENFTILEGGAQRSFSKFSLFTDGWSTTTFRMCDKGEVYSVDNSEDALNGVCYPLSSYAYSTTVGKMETLIPRLILSKSPSLIYLDGPDDPKVTKDVLSYVIPYMQENAKVNAPIAVLLDDVGIKYTICNPEKALLQAGAYVCRRQGSLAVRTVTHPEPFELYYDQMLAVIWPHEPAKGSAIVSDWAASLCSNMGVTDLSLPELYVL